MSAVSYTKALTEPLIKNNPLTFQILGVCSALAVTSSMKVTLVMCISVTLVTACSSMVLSMIRSQIPTSIRIIVQMTVIAALVIMVEQILRAYAYDAAKALSVFIGLIVTNCIVMGRAEAYAMSNPPIQSFLDGIGNGMGYSLVLIVVSIVRELIGKGALLDFTILPLVKNGGWYEPNGMMLLPPSGFFIIAGLIVIARMRMPEQVEKADYAIFKAAQPMAQSQH